MADSYFTILAGQLGISIWLLVVLIIWSAVWKLIALWRSARNNHIAWFIIIVILNTAGILPIIYIFGFSGLKRKKKQRKKKSKKK